MKITNWLYRIFNWRKSPKATNEMKPVDMSGYNGELVLDNDIKDFINCKYWRVKKSWKRSPKKYFVWLSHSRGIELRRYSTSIHELDMFLGNLYELYQQYYGKENNN